MSERKAILKVGYTQFVTDVSTALVLDEHLTFRPTALCCARLTHQSALTLSLSLELNLLSKILSGILHSERNRRLSHDR